MVRKNVPRNWRLFSSGTALSSCTLSESSKVSDTAARCSFHGRTVSAPVCPAHRAARRAHTNPSWSSFLMNSVGCRTPHQLRATKGETRERARAMPLDSCGRSKLQDKLGFRNGHASSTKETVLLYLIQDSEILGSQ